MVDWWEAAPKGLGDVNCGGWVIDLIPPVSIMVIWGVKMRIGHVNKLVDEVRVRMQGDFSSEVWIAYRIGEGGLALKAECADCNEGCSCVEVR